MIKILLLLTVTSGAQIFSQESITGVWQTIDDETKEARSLVELHINEGKLYGKIIKLFPQEGEPKAPKCEKCKGNRKNQPILGMQIIDGLSLKKNKWIDGVILDPNNGKNYDCKIWLEDGKLQVRGYLGFFFRTQEWIRYIETINLAPNNNE